jgi:Saxitoxin biosynthesis operon protein SxtJ
MQWSDISWMPPGRQLRQFAALWTGFFLLLACWHGWANANLRLAAVLAGVALTIGPIGLVSPAAVRPVYVGWMALAFPMSWFVSRAVLACLFYGLFMPLGVAFWLMGRDPLTLRRKTGCETYWTAKAQLRDVRRYLRTF